MYVMHESNSENREQWLVKEDNIVVECREGQWWYGDNELICLAEEFFVFSDDLD